jgi:KipI family sensor histidine kinase inhibitor
MEFIANSDASLLVRFGRTIDSAVHRRTLALFRALAARRDPRVTNLHPAYASLLIDFDPLALSHAELEALIEGLDVGESPDESPPLVHDLPVCYDAELAIDLMDVCAFTGFTPEQLIAAHTAPEYLVYFLGFSPGFAYLGGLPPDLVVPRLASPRKVVPAGSVAIGGAQTGVYPVESPGGWRIIGRTPVPLFFPENTVRPTLFQPGDRVRFTLLSRQQFEERVRLRHG